MKARLGYLRNLHSAATKIASSPHLPDPVRQQGANVASAARRELDFHRTMVRSFTNSLRPKPPAKPPKLVPVQGATPAQPPPRSLQGVVNPSSPQLKPPPIPKLT